VVVVSGERDFGLFFAAASAGWPQNATTTMAVTRVAT
jgi:hypothetical protein